MITLYTLLATAYHPIAAFPKENLQIYYS